LARGRKVRWRSNSRALQHVSFRTVAAPARRSRGLNSENGNTQSRTETREHLANERTLLSWVRTGISLISLGLVVERAGALAQAVDFQIGVKTSSDFFGLALALLGALALILGTLQFLRNRRSISTGDFESSVTSYLIVVAGSLAFAGAFVIYVIFA
jgi:putative membrane protein